MSSPARNVWLSLMPSNSRAGARAVGHGFFPKAISYVRLSSLKLQQLRKAQTILLSPLSYGSEQEWCLSALHAAKELLGVDVALFALAHGAEPLTVTEDFDSRLFPTIHGVDDGIFEFSDDSPSAVQRLARRTQMQVYDFRDMVQVATGQRLEETQHYQEFIEPVGVIDPITIQVAVARGTAIIAVGHRAGQREIFRNSTEWHFAELLAPALEAGANTLVRLAKHRASLTALLDELRVATIAYDISGVEIARSSEALRLIGTETESAFQKQIDALVREVRTSFALGHYSAQIPTPLRLRTPSAEYTARISLVEAGILSPNPVLLVILESHTANLPSVQQLQSAFSLTKREAEIALLLARGASNAKIANQLNISPSTVRTHAERIFPKLGIHSRKALGLQLMRGIL